MEGKSSEEPCVPRLSVAIELDDLEDERFFLEFERRLNAKEELVLEAHLSEIVRFSSPVPPRTLDLSSGC